MNRVFFNLATVTAWCAVLFPSRTFAAGGPFGLGVIVGNPTGLSLKYILSPTNAVVGAAAWHLDGGLHLHGDYLFIWPDFIPTRKNPLAGYIGAGARLRTWDDSPCHWNHHRCDDDDDDEEVSLGVRVPFGMAYAFSPHPFEVFAEIVPTLDLVPGTDLDLDLAIGGRFYF